MNVGACTDKGKVRDLNEDAFVARPDVGLFAVADGMGGYAAGEVASRLAIEALVHVVEQAHAAPEARLREAFEAAHRAVRDEAQRNGASMGTTLTAVLMQGHQITVGHVGDSRAYLVQADGVTQLTDDHSLVAQLVREGYLTEEQAARHPQKNILTQALGSTEALSVDVFSLPLPPDAALLLCSDGLSNMVTSAEIAKIVHHTVDAQHAAQRLVDLANRRGGPDNITALVIKPSAAPARRSPPLRAPFLALLVISLLLGAAALGGQWYLERSFYLGEWGGRVAIYRGVPLKIGGVSLSYLEVITTLRVQDVLPAYQQRIQEGIFVKDLSDAFQRLKVIAAPQLKPKPKPPAQQKPPVTPKEAEGHGLPVSTLAR
ncbi:MAG: Stp1/IreP family PP2C-type Ser/Thr phosphatase [Abditibacteriales bacterium]|nr:Stp1/IreP family PP2C-type Ser/Thr phosphatase [Abditibacteriales bacterium]MDW8367691.1 Stp1/IreP family PP2C-type Ser/Thr phosphatase [Abditibacteriales bacterium]